MEWFGVRHFAGAVIYNVDGFVEKNVNKTYHGFVPLLQNSTNGIIKDLS